MLNTQVRPTRPVRPLGMGVKIMGNTEIRLGRYKIKTFLAQPKNVDVKQNSRVVRRMVVRRSILALEEGTTIKNKH